MKRQLLTMLSIMFVLPLLLAVPAGAAEAKFGIGIFGGYNAFAMELNDLSSVTPIFDISGGVGFGGGVRIRTSRSLLLSLDFERLTASMSSSGATGGVSYKADLDMPANAIVGGATYYFLHSSRARFGLTGGLGYYKADGRGTIDLDDGVNTFTRSGDVTGGGVGLHAGGALDVSMSPVAQFEAMIGYRMAKASDLEDRERTTIHGSADWSGFMSRAGFSLFFGSQ